ncbi:MAG TPA: glycosyltransferase [Bacteroidia bacterium]|nr:glycosyltransferase [Bacteroidia bacterium]
MINKLPYIVNTRKSNKLLQNLLIDDAPILFEGLHSCYYLGSVLLKNRLKIVRTHNIEHDYYANLAQSEDKFLKKIYFQQEAKKLKQFELKLQFADNIAAISANDTYHFKRNFKSVYTISAFHPYNKVEIKDGIGSYALYHGNLAVAENNLGALYLVNEVFCKINFPLIIAGSQPSVALKEAVAKHHHIKLKGDISTHEINDLIANAQINVLPTFQATGIKLKLLAALYSGRHCLVNNPMVANTGLEEICIVKDTAKEMIDAIEKLKLVTMDESMISKRRKVLEQDFSNKYNASMLIKLINESVK